MLLAAGAVVCTFRSWSPIGLSEKVTLSQDPKEVTEHARQVSAWKSVIDRITARARPWVRSEAGLLKEQGFLYGPRGMNKRSRRVDQSHTRPDAGGPYRTQLEFLLLP